MKKIKIGQLGVCHEHASGKIRTLKLRPDLFDIVGVADDRQSMSAKYDGANLDYYKGLPFMSEEELFAVPGLEAVVVEVPNLDLVATANRCLEQNLPIHMDKPGGISYEAYCHMRKGFEERNLAFQMGYMFRGNPAIQWIQKAVKKDWLGEVFGIQADMDHNYGGARYQQYISNFSGGLMLNLGCHLIDIVVSLLGRPTGVTPFLKSVGEPLTFNKNNCAAVLEYPHTIVMLRSCSKESCGIPGRRFKISGTKGTVDICPIELFGDKEFTMKLHLTEGNEDYSAGEHLVNFGCIRDRYERELESFVQYIQKEATNPYDSAHDCLVEEVVLAASGYTTWSY